MPIAKTLKRSALAAVLILATAGASLAATGWMENDAPLRHKPSHIAKKVNWVHDGQQVEVVGAYKSWYKLKVPGKDGWVKKGLVSFHEPHWGYGWGKSGWGYGLGGSFCVQGQTASICIGGGY